MEINELVSSVQRLSNEAGLAINEADPEKAKVKLELLAALLSEEVKFLVKVETDKVEEPADADDLESEADADEEPEDPGPEAQPSDE